MILHLKWIVLYFSLIFPFKPPYFWGFSIHIPSLATTVIPQAALRSVAMQLGHEEVEPLWQHFGAAAAQMGCHPGVFGWKGHRQSY
jgi:hypothetical protein